MRVSRARLRRANDVGDVAFRAFYVANKSRWRALASALMKKFRAFYPAWYEWRDCEQDVLIGAWNAFQAYEPDKTRVSIEDFVSIRAYYHATKAILRAGEVPQHRRNGPARFAIAESHLEGNTTANDARRELGQLTQLTQVYMIDFEARCDALDALIAKSRTLLEVHAVRAWVHSGNDIDRAAARLYADPVMRRVCRLGSEQQARKLASRSVLAVAERLFEEAT